MTFSNLVASSTLTPWSHVTSDREKAWLTAFPDAHAPASTRSRAEECSRVWEEVGKQGEGPLLSWATLCIQWGPNVSAL